MQIIKGTLDIIVLKTLADGPKHGFAVAAAIDAHFGGELVVEEGALYQSLRRMEARGWLTAEWGASANNRTARYYRLTPKGRQQLKSETESWRRYSTALSRLLG